MLLLFASRCKKVDTNEEANNFTDSRDGNNYKTVKIGNQVWLAENLKYLPSIAGPEIGSRTTPYYYVYDYNGTSIEDAKATVNYKTYGVLYNWEAAKVACPKGWHLPSDEEWKQLIDYLGGGDVAGGKLKEIGTTLWNSPNTEATDVVGFTALPGGRRNYNGEFVNIRDFGLWWCATELYTNLAFLRGMAYDGGYVSNLEDDKAVGLSVRCVKD